MKDGKFKNFKKTLFQHSEEKENYYKMIDEWRKYNLDYDEKCKGVCICGQHGLYKLYTIMNKVNGKTLQYVGSICINRVNNEKIEYYELKKPRNMTMTIGKYKGWKFDDICVDKGYIKFLKGLPKYRKEYKDLINYYNFYYI